MLKAVIIIGAVMGIAVLGLNAYLSPDSLRGCQAVPSTGNCEKADAIVAVSGGNTQIRAAEAIRLYKNGWGDYIIFSGAAKDTSGPSNAEVMRQQALAAGIPNKAVIIDDSSQTTHQNAQETAAIISDREIRTIILVTSPYHQRRASVEFQAILGNAVTVKNHPASDDPDWPQWWWITPRGWWLAGGETIKIIFTHVGESR